MYFTKFMKGVPQSPSFGDSEAERTLLEDGIICNWWRNSPGGSITPSEVSDRLNDETNLYWHLERYDEPKFPSAVPFRDETPFISTTAGVVERDRFRARNIAYPPLLTALSFATAGLQRPGYIFYGYVITLGRKAIPFREYAEETRELNIYTSYLRFHEEGELVAKIHIPSHRLERVVRWDSNMIAQLQSGHRPTPAPPYPVDNPNYTPPEQYSNIRELLFGPGVDV